ncbi:MAG: hypothetical protein J6V67_04180, partial [Campylobacter sp.]|uniref:hypothetical protein n=1 Tax=Campylobacter sp. TaxID=205 RepID=UPI001B08A9B8
ARRRYMQNYDKEAEAQAFEEFQRELEARFKAEGTPSNFMKNIVALSAINFRLAKAVYDLKSNTKFYLKYHKATALKN